MYCGNKNYLLDLYYNEGNNNYLTDIKNHLENCENCKNEYAKLQKSLTVLNKIEIEQPSNMVLKNILKETAIINSIINNEISNGSNFLNPIIQIIVGIVFVSLVVYIISIKLSLSPIWNYIKSTWFGDSFGSIGVAALIVFIMGSFVTLAISPIMFLTYHQRKNFN